MRPLGPSYTPGCLFTKNGPTYAGQLAFIVANVSAIGFPLGYRMVKDDVRCVRGQRTPFMIIHDHDVIHTLFLQPRRVS